MVRTATWQHQIYEAVWWGRRTGKKQFVFKCRYCKAYPHWNIVDTDKRDR